MTNQEALKWLNEVKIFSLTFRNNNDRKAINLAVESLEKQIPKKPRIIPDKICGNIIRYRCPVCDEFFGERGNRNVILFEMKHHCGNCNQAIDWEGEYEPRIKITS